MDDAKPSWIDDPHIARRLARATWMVLVAAFVLLTRYDFGASAERGAIAAVIFAIGMLNAPVAIGLWKSRGEASSRAFRAVALALGMRVLAAAWIVWLLSAA